eukprot:25719-Eustigmatos_ZCMA.PRE.1
MDVDGSALPTDTSTPTPRGVTCASVGGPFLHVGPCGTAERAAIVVCSADTEDKRSRLEPIPHGG